MSTRKETLRVRVTKTEMKSWRKAARKHAGGNVSLYVRACVNKAAAVNDQATPQDAGQ